MSIQCFFYQKNFLSQSSYIIFVTYFLDTNLWGRLFNKYVFFYVFFFQVVFARWIDGYFLLLKLLI